jgi:hypothetical protein
MSADHKSCVRIFGAVYIFLINTTAFTTVTKIKRTRVSMAGQLRFKFIYITKLSTMYKSNKFDNRLCFVKSWKFLLFGNIDLRHLNIQWPFVGNYRIPKYILRIFWYGKTKSPSFSASVTRCGSLVANWRMVGCWLLYIIKKYFF